MRDVTRSKNLRATAIVGAHKESGNDQEKRSEYIIKQNYLAKINESTTFLETHLRQYVHLPLQDSVNLLPRDSGSCVHS